MYAKVKVTHLQILIPIGITSNLVPFAICVALSMVCKSHIHINWVLADVYVIIIFMHHQELITYISPICSKMKRDITTVNVTHSHYHNRGMKDLIL